MGPRVVTISATFGAGGSVIGRAVAARLGVPFVDRAIPISVATEIGCPLEEALAHDDRAEHGIARLLAGAARLPNVAMGGMDVYLPDQTTVPPEEFVVRTAQAIKRAVAVGGGVVLGRAGAVVLRDHPHALHVRLDGPAERRLERACAAEQIAAADRRTVQRMMLDNDRARTAYVKHFYRADPAASGLYHLVIDSTALPDGCVADLIVTAARQT